MIIAFLFNLFFCVGGLWWSSKSSTGTCWQRYQKVKFSALVSWLFLLCVMISRSVCLCSQSIQIGIRPAQKAVQQLRLLCRPLCSHWKQTSNVFLGHELCPCVSGCVDDWDVWLECWRGTEWQVWTLVGGRAVWHHCHPKGWRGGVSFLLIWAQPDPPQPQNMNRNVIQFRQSLGIYLLVLLSTEKCSPVCSDTWGLNPRNLIILLHQLSTTRPQRCSCRHTFLIQLELWYVFIHHQFMLYAKFNVAE